MPARRAHRFLTAIVLAALCFGAACRLANETSAGWSRTFGAVGHDEAGEVVQAPDGGFAVAGWTQSFGAALYDAWLIRTDVEGNRLWDKIFDRTDYDRAYSVKQTSDGGFILAGTTGSSDADAWLIRTDAEGNRVWDRVFGTEDHDWAKEVIQTPDGGFLLVGYTNTVRAWLIRTDPQGNKLWEKTYEAYAVAADQAADGGFILAGAVPSETLGYYDGWLARTDAAGETLWTRTFDLRKADVAYSVRQTADGGFVLAGYTNALPSGGDDGWLLKTDADGSLLWEKTIGGNEEDRFYSVELTSDGGLILAGYTQSAGAGRSDAWLVSTDAQGNTLWERTLGGANWDVAFSVRQTADNGFVLAGYTESFGAGESDAWLVKTDSLGNTTFP